jgi:hypothetical protein
MESLRNNESSIKIPNVHQTKKLTSLYNDALENVIDLKEQISVTKKALQDGPIEKGSRILTEVEKYRKHLGIKE